MDTEKRIRELREWARKRPGFKSASANAEITSALLNRMECLGIKKSELAKRINVSPAYISKMLNGENNFTVEKLIQVAHALDAAWEFCLRPDEQNQQDSLADESAIHASKVNVKYRHFSSQEEQYYSASENETEASVNGLAS